ncbi:Cys-tRNA(Pro) deacylase [Gottfriedia solisilvae]|uniref:Cys-tRNA(Pro)/Cys-tRNA(Cys) deacylase n=1 Tax=Gottfriedia solisilvae TaxID=1516104 RepID=A0A8J3AGL2_9BACI|nr:Cys-tRNA(Pro) deacylase [Gottfriedia solisilvae]GGI13469.1 Cys-tRNA(Pro)/Cys-tRNA(Cys) deacylase [Gottfriedia solisilvae]
MSGSKTNAMRILDSKKVQYQTFSYEVTDGKIDGVSVANKIGKVPEMVFKTLVSITPSKSIYVFVIPVEKELDLKLAAKVAGEKKLELLPVKDLLTNTGYVRGGCSPIGMKKQFPTIIEQSADRLTEIIVSGGKIGIQLQLNVNDLIQTTRSKLAKVAK